jgi:uncharacterized protein YcaQ
MKSHTINKEQLQNYLINRSFLHQKAASVLEVLEFYKCIQVDPISVVARSHELALWNRVEDFRISDLHTELYTNRNFFEYWLQLFSIIPIKYFPYFKARFTTKKGWQEEYAKTHAKEIQLALDFIYEHGLTKPSDLTHIPKIGSLFSWNNGSSRTALLEYLWDTGKIMIAHRKNNQKYYDLTERLLPKNVLYQEVSEKESLGFLFKSFFDYLGIVRKSFLISGRVGYVKRLGFAEIFEECEKSGKIVKLQLVDSKATYYVFKEQIKEIKSLGKANLHTGLNILPPLDPLIIDRKILKDIFDFSYTWEAYTPKVKRKFGYYGMPILYQGKFVGQIDLKKNKEGKIETLNLQTDVKTAEFKKELKETIRDLERFINNK